MEFQNKFYGGQGFKFLPFTFESILDGRFEEWNHFFFFSVNVFSLQILFCSVVGIVFIGFCVHLSQRCHSKMTSRLPVRAGLTLIIQSISWNLFLCLCYIFCQNRISVYIWVKNVFANHKMKIRADSFSELHAASFLFFICLICEAHVFSLNNPKWRPHNDLKRSTIKLKRIKAPLVWTSGIFFLCPNTNKLHVCCHRNLLGCVFCRKMRGICVCGWICAYSITNGHIHIIFLSSAAFVTLLFKGSYEKWQWFVGACLPFNQSSIYSWIKWERLVDVPVGVFSFLNLTYISSNYSYFKAETIHTVWKKYFL